MLKIKLILGAGLLLFLAACGTQRQTSSAIPASIVPYDSNYQQYDDLMTSGRSTNVAMLLPLTGKSGHIGEEMRNAGLLAQFETANNNFVLQFYDTKGTDVGAKQALEEALAHDVDLILGPLYAHEVGAIRWTAKRKGVPVVSFTSDSDEVSDGVYTMALLLSTQATRAVRFACEKGKTRLAIMAPDNKAGDIATDTARNVARMCGMEVTHVSVYNPTFINFEPYVLKVLPPEFADKKNERDRQKEEKRKIRAGLIKSPTKSQKSEIPIADQLDFDALFIADDGNRLKSIASLFALYDVMPSDVMFLGMSTWQDNSLTVEGALVDGYFPSLPQVGFENFSKRYQEVYGAKPIRLASLAYDAVAMASILSVHEGFSKDALTSPGGFLGTDGLFRLMPNGRSDRLMGISKIVGRNTFKMQERPLANFEQEEIQMEQLDSMRMANESKREEKKLKALMQPDVTGQSVIQLEEVSEQGSSTADFVDEADMINARPSEEELLD